MMDLSSIQIGIIMLCFVLALMALSMPVAVTLLVGGLIGLILIRGMNPALTALGYLTWYQGTKEILLVIPLFTWMGMLAATGGISKDAFTGVYKLVGHFRGGLAMACTVACAAFGAVCGNNIATAVTMTTVALPEMRKYKYADYFSLGTISASGNLGIMIPPSGSFVIYGFITETSIGALFIAGILPGILVTLLYMVQIYIQARLNPNIAPLGPSVRWGERVKGSALLLPIILVFVIVMGGIYAGLFTPTEAASVGVFIVFLIALIKRKLNFRDFTDSMRQTLIVSAFIILMVVGAMYFGSFLSTSGIPSALTRIVAGLELNSYIILIIVLIIYIFAGMILDIFAVLVITLPIFFPIVISGLGFDPLQFGVLCVLTIMIGSISPPFGMVVYALAGMNKDVPVTSIFRGVLPFIVTLIVALLICVFIPDISTFLADSMMPYRSL
jgi:C4-dicarboxylate transporter, DctM subunit